MEVCKRYNLKHTRYLRRWWPEEEMLLLMKPSQKRHQTSRGHSSGKKICVRTCRLRPDAPGAREALDAPWQGTYRSQRETHRLCEFGRSSPWHRAFGRRMPGRRASGHSSPWHLLTGRSVSGHFSSGRSRVRANGIRTTRVVAPRSRCLSKHGTS